MNHHFSSFDTLKVDKMLPHPQICVNLCLLFDIAFDNVEYTVTSTTLGWVFHNFHAEAMPQK